jgi:hypothetical protein
MRFFFEMSHSTFDLAYLGAFFDPEFPATVRRTLHFAQRLVFARPVAVFLGGGIFCGPSFYFIEKQLPFDPSMRFSEIAGFFGGRLLARSTASGDKEQDETHYEKYPHAHRMEG